MPEHIPWWVIMALAGFALFLGFYLQWIDPQEVAKRAEFEAKTAEAKQRIRLAEKDIPHSVAAQAALIELEAKLKIQLLEAESRIKLETERGNAQKVLEFTRKKVELEKELEKLRG